jgi:PAS domain S-box-containing protein
MKATSKTKAELVAEIDSLRSKVAKLERLAAHSDSRSADTLDNKPSGQSARERLKDSEKPLGQRFCESLPTNECIVEVLNRATYGLIILDEHLVVKYFNKAAEKLLGRQSDEVVNRKLLDVFPEARGSIFEKQYLRALKEKQAFTFETFFEKSPYQNWYDVSVSPCKDGIVVHFVVTTERKQAEEALRRSEEQLRLLTDSLPALISYVDAQQCFRFNNKSYEMWFGYSRSEAYGKHVKDIIGEAVYKTIRPHVEEALSGKQVTFECSIPYKNTEQREVQYTYVPDIENGQVKGFFALIQDTSERKRHEKILQKTLRSLGDAQRIAHIGNWDWDIESNELNWSDEIYRIFGLTPQRFGATYEAFLASVHPDDRDFVQQGVNEALYKGNTYSIDHRIIRPDGTERVVHEQAEVVFNADGKPSRMIGTVQDVTEAKQAEDALQERLRFERFLSGISAGFINSPGERATEEIERGLMEIVKLMGLDGAAVIQCLKDGEQIAVTHFWAFPPTPSLSGLIINDRFPWFTQQARHGALLALERLPDDLPEEALAEKALCQKWGYKSIISIPLQVGGSNLGAVVFASREKFREWRQSTVQRLKLLGEIFANALSRAQTEEHSRELRAELSHVSRAATLGELAASLAHELNQPLAAILANAQAAQRYLSNRPSNLEEISEILSDIVADDKRAGAIIYKLRALLKKGEPKFEPLNLNAITAEVVTLLKNDAMIRGVSLDLQVAPELPEALGDRVQLQQVLMNLILNACEIAAGELPERRKVIIGTERRDEQTIRVTVTDFGPGLPANVKQLFEPFYSTKANGLGMGLTISQSIVEAHGGRIWASNNPDRGASFSFTVMVDAGDAHGK